MKKTYSILSIAVMAILAIAVAVVSCKKEKQEQTCTDLERVVQLSDNMDEYLISFKEKLLSAQKGEEAISLEQARQDLCNLLNFDFGDAGYDPEILIIDTLHIELALTNGEVDLSQLAVTYENAVNSILKTFHGIDLPYKTVYCILCNFKPMDSKESEIMDSEIVVVTSYDPGAVYTNNHDTLDWHPKNQAGSCDGQLVNIYGAPEIIRSWVFQSLNPLTCLYGGRIYYTETSDWIFYGYRFYDYTNECFKIYTSFETNQNTICIPHEEMEYYYSQLLTLYGQQPFGNHRIISLSIEHVYFENHYIPVFDDYRSGYTWKITLHHGKPNFTGEPVLD
jgi:hypothetical protein